MQKKKNDYYLNVYKLRARDTYEYRLDSREKPMVSSPVSFSPDAKKVAYAAQKNNIKSVAVLELDTQKTVYLKDLLTNPENSFTERGRSEIPIIWLDSERIIYENSIPFKRSGIIIVNLNTKEEELFLDRCINPALSHDKKKIAFRSAAKTDSSTINLYNLETQENTTLMEDLPGYVDFISWSPDDNSLAVGYSFREGNTTLVLQRVAIIDMNGTFSSISEMQLLSNPQWVDENTLLVTESQIKDFAIKSSTVKGLLAYNRTDGSFQTVTNKIRSRYYFLSPNKKLVIAGVSGKNIYMLKIKRTRKGTLMTD
ncbi:MAG: hypothetical protein ABII27_00735 [bacterium]